MANSNIAKKFNWPLVGNEHVIDFLSKSILNEKIVHTYIFLGPEDLGKTTVANYFAKSLLCQKRGKENIILPCDDCSSCQQFKHTPDTFEPTPGILLNSFSPQEATGAKRDLFKGGDKIIHGDFHLVKKEKDKKNISIEQIRDFIKILGMSSFLGLYKVGVIKDANSLNIEAANALLKILEEPKERVVIILITSSMESIPATIISRSQVINFYPVKNSVIYDYLIKEHKTSRSIAKNLSRVCLGRPALAVKFLKDKDFYEDYMAKVNIFLNFTGQDINERIEGVGEIIGSNIYSQESVKLAFKIIEVWQGLVRDLLLLNFSLDDLIQHQIIDEELNKIRNKFKLNNLLKIAKSFRQAKEYLRANVSPKLVLENIAINI